MQYESAISALSPWIISLDCLSPLGNKVSHPLFHPPGPLNSDCLHAGPLLVCFLLLLHLKKISVLSTLPLSNAFQDSPHLRGRVPFCAAFNGCNSLCSPVCLCRPSLICLRAPLPPSSLSSPSHIKTLSSLQTPFHLPLMFPCGEAG